MRGRAVGTGTTTLIHVAVDAARNVVEPPGVRVHRMTRLDERVRWNLGPPRVRYEEAVLDVATEARDRLASIAVLADACGDRRTTAGRLLAAAGGRPRLADRDWVVQVLATSRPAPARCSSTAT